MSSSYHNQAFSINNKRNNNGGSSSSSSLPASAPVGQAALHNILLNDRTRHCISDSVLTRYYNNSSSSATTTSSRDGVATHYYDNRNITFLMYNRSGGSTVKTIIPVILERCRAVAQQQHQLRLQVYNNCSEFAKLQDVNAVVVVVAAPEEECYLLAQWAVDCYYKVVIAGNGGIFALIQAMQAFPNAQGLQECCCTALGNLCANSESNQKAVCAAGGIRQIVAAMTMYPQSVAVQSAACEALRNSMIIMAGTTMSSYWQQQQQQQPVEGEVQSSSVSNGELIDVLQHAKEMCLHPNHRRTAEKLLSVAVMNSLEPQQFR